MWEIVVEDHILSTSGDALRAAQPWEIFVEGHILSIGGDALQIVQPGMWNIGSEE
jgi:hypothetical protein